MAVANDSIYVNIIAKTQEAVSGINGLLKTITLTGAGMFAFRKAAQLVGQAFTELRKQNKDLDDAMKVAQTGLKDLMAAGLSPWKDDIRDIANGFADLAEKMTGARKAAEEYAKTQEEIKRTMANLTGTIAEYNMKLAEARVQDALQTYATAMVQFDKQVEKYKKERNEAIALYNKSGVGKPLPEMTTEKAAEIVRAGGAGVSAELDAAKKQYEDAKKAFEDAKKSYEAAKPAGVDLTLSPGGIDWEGVRKRVGEQLQQDRQTAIDDLQRQLDELNAAPVLAMFSDNDLAILEEIKAMREEDEPWLKLFRDDDVEVLKELQALKAEDPQAYSDEFRKVAGYISQATESLLSGDITGALQGVFQAIWDQMVVPYCIAAAAKAAAVFNYAEAVFWLALAGVGSGLIGAMGNMGGQEQQPAQYSQYPVYPGESDTQQAAKYMAQPGSRSIVIVNNVAGSVVTERQLAVNTFAEAARW
jgi:tetratricopeptide (TPR) repeat protein